MTFIFLFSSYDFLWLVMTQAVRIVYIGPSWGRMQAIFYPLTLIWVTSLWAKPLPTSYALCVSYLPLSTSCVLYISYLPLSTSCALYTSFIPLIYKLRAVYKLSPLSASCALHTSYPSSYPLVYKLRAVYKFVHIVCLLVIVLQQAPITFFLFP